MAAGTHAETGCNARANDAQDHARYRDQRRRFMRADGCGLREWGRRSGQPHRAAANADTHAACAESGAEPEANADVGNNPGNADDPDARAERNGGGADAHVCADWDTLLLRPVRAMPDDTAALFRLRVRAVHSKPADLPARRSAPLRIDGRHCGMLRVRDADGDGDA
jgi:hypothetical protein